MTLFTTDYLEYYLTLLSWVIHNGIWAVLVSSGVFAIPFVAIIIQEWLRARAEGADDGLSLLAGGDAAQQQQPRLLFVQQVVVRELWRGGQAEGGGAAST